MISSDIMAYSVLKDGYGWLFFQALVRIYLVPVSDHL